MGRAELRRTYYRHGSESPYYRVRISLNCPGAMGVCVDVLVMEKMLCIIARSGPGKRQLQPRTSANQGDFIVIGKDATHSDFIDRNVKFSKSNNRVDLQQQQEKFEFYKIRPRGDKIAWIQCFLRNHSNFWIIISSNKIIF